jgi:hypothetical protein
MKSIPFIMIMTLILFTFLVNSVSAQQDPSDPGEADTLYFTAGYPFSPDGDTVFFPEGGGDVTIHINIWNDDSLRGIAVPLTDLAYGPPSYAILDSAKNNGAEDPLCFVGSRVEDFEVKICNLALNPPRVLYGAVIFQVEPMPPGDGLFATMVFTVEDTGTICLDTTFFPPQNSLKFVTGVQTIGFTPQFISRCFHTAPYLCGDANGDRFVDIVDVVYLVNYLFKEGPAPVFPSDANCDQNTDIADAVYLVNYVLKDGPPPCDPNEDGEPDC